MNSSRSRYGNDCIGSYVSFCAIVALIRFCEVFFKLYCFSFAKAIARADHICTFGMTRWIEFMKHCNHFGRVTSATKHHHEVRGISAVAFMGLRSIGRKNCLETDKREACEEDSRGEDERKAHKHKSRGPDSHCVGRG